MEKIKTAHVITRLILGGAQENTVYTVQGLQGMDEYDVDLISGPDLGPEGGILDYNPCRNVIYVSGLTRNIKPLKDLVALWQLYVLFKKKKYDIVHTHSSKAGIIGRIAAKLAGVKCIVHTIHGLAYDKYQPFFKRHLYVLLEKLCARMSTKILSVCDCMSIQALGYGVGRKAQYQTVYSGSNVEPFKRHYDPDMVRYKYKLPEGRFLVAKVARFFHFKGYEYVLDVAKGLCRQYPDIVFVLVGDGPMREEFENNAKKMGLADNFIFTGLLKPDAVPELLAGVDAVMHLSLREGLARVIPQAMLMKKPVISFDIGGAKEVIEQNRNGFVIPPGKAGQVAQKIEILYNYPSMAREFGQRGYSKVVSMFDKDEMVRRIDAVYKKLLAAAQNQK